MKQILLLAIACISMFALKAQAPEGFSYQAVIRNSNGSLVAEIDASSSCNGMYMIRIRSGASWYKSKMVVAK